MSNSSDDSYTICQKQSGTCNVVTYQNANVAIPVTVKPKIHTGEISTICCGEPKITQSPYVLRCNPKKEICRFTITQDVRIEIPIEISANAFVEAPYICCEDNESCECVDYNP